MSCVRTRESGEPVLQILGNDGKPYALVFYSDKTTAEHVASYADARLIAAAPDMLAALKDIVDRNEIQHWFNVDNALAAIAKATAA